jgi:hypothetical protein
MACDNTEDTVSVQLAVGTRDRLVQLWKHDHKGQLHSLFSVRLDATVPKGVAFAENADNDIYVFGLYDGNR